MYNYGHLIWLLLHFWICCITPDTLVAHSEESTQQYEPLQADRNCKCLKKKQHLWQQIRTKSIINLYPWHQETFIYTLMLFWWHFSAYIHFVSRRWVIMSFLAKSQFVAKSQKKCMHISLIRPILRKLQSLLCIVDECYGFLERMCYARGKTERVHNYSNVSPPFPFPPCFYKPPQGMLLYKPPQI